MEFDFGPISRTVDASTGKGDAINFASLPIHEAMTALLAGSNRDEFVAWLWHDIFKALFHWPRRTNWSHLPDVPCTMPKIQEARFAKATNVPVGLVATHHPRAYRRCQNILQSLPSFSYMEESTLSNEFDQVAIGKEAHFIQLSFLAEPATHTALLRTVIADAFMEVVTKMVADTIERKLASKTPTFKRVRYAFDFKRVQLSSPPTHSEIASLAKQYNMLVSSDELVIEHLVPLAKPDLDGRHAQVVIDLTAEPPTAKRFDEGVISLVELLTVYQDSRTVLMGIPQFLQIDTGQLREQVISAAELRLRNLDIRTLASEDELKRQAKAWSRVDWGALPLIRQGRDIDLLAHVFAEQVEIRQIGGGQSTEKVRLLSEIVSRPVVLLRSKSRRCRFCNTAFDSDLPPGEAVVGGYFTDVEHVGFGGDICPMCRVYFLNSHKSRTKAEKAQGITGDRKGYRGAFALVSPSSHFTYAEDQCQLVEQPPLDMGGRFANPLQRATVTLQEYGLFNMLSRRIIARIWTQMDAANRTKPLPLPYLGAILLTQDNRDQIVTMFNCLELLFDTVELLAYPFKVTVQPAVELSFEMAVNDLQKHHTKHTYLKANPSVISVDPNSKFTILVDNGLQMEVSRRFFEDRKRMNKLLASIKGQKRQHDWLLAVAQGMDPVTATMEAFYNHDNPIRDAEQAFWDTQLGAADLGRQWQRYEEVHDEVNCILAKYPMLIEFFVKPRRR